MSTSANLIEQLQNENTRLRQQLALIRDHGPQLGGDASLLAHTVLNTLHQHIAITQPDGTITTVNTGWEQFARDNGDPGFIATGVGVNYLDVCRRAAALNSPQAQAVLDGLLAVIHGELPAFELEYPCHAPAQPRWFVLQVLPMPHTTPPNLLIMHTDVTARKLAELALSESEARYRAVFETISDFAYIVRVRADGTRQPEWVTPAPSRLTGYPPDVMLQLGMWQQITHPDDWPIVQHQIDELLANRSASVEYRLISATGEVHWVLDHAQPEWDDQQQRVIRIMGAIQDITERKRAEHNLELLAQAGRELSLTLNLRDIYATLLRLLRGAMHCEYLFVSDFNSNDQLIRCVYGSGPHGEFDVAHFPPIPLEAQGRGTQSQVIRSGQPLLINDYDTYVRAATPGYLIAEDGQLMPENYDGDDTPRSALIVPLQLAGRVVGVIQALSPYANDYTPRDLQFLESLAAHAATAMANARLFDQVQRELAERRQAEAALHTSEQKFRDFVEQVAVGVSFTAPDGRIIEWNEAISRITGIAHADAVGRYAWEVQAQLVPPERRQKYTQDILRDLWLRDTRVFNTIKTIEVTLQHPHLGLRLIEESVFPISTQHGRLLGQLVRDITDQRRLEERHRLLFEQANDAIFIEDDEDNILEVNQRACDLLGYTREELLRLKITDLQAPEVRGPIGQTLQTEVAHYGGRPFEAIDLRRDGTRVPVEVTISPLRDGHRQLIMSIVRDISQRKQAEDQLHLQSAALEAAANGIIITDRTGQIEWANPAFMELTGYTLAEVIGRNPRDLIRSDRQSRQFYRRLWDTILSGQVWHGEITNRRKDGRLYVEDMTITPVHGGQPASSTHFIAIKQDITVRKQVDQALRQYAERLQTLHDIDRGVAVAQSPQETAMTALRHIRRLMPVDHASITLFNPATQHMTVLAAFTHQPDEQPDPAHLSIPAAALTPLLNQQIIFVEDTATDERLTEQAVNHSLLSDNVRSYITAPLIADNELMGTLNVGSTRPRAYDADHLDIIRELSVQLGIALHQARLRELIQQHAAQLEERVRQRTRELAAANERLQELDILKSQFVSEVSHELRTPVTGLVLYLDLLVNGKPDKHDHYLGSAMQQALRMKQLIEDILDLSRLERDKSELTLDHVDLNAVLDQVVVAQLPRAEAKGLIITLELATELSPVRGDINRLRQVATNLIVNAINYTASGTVHIRSIQQPERARVGFTVRDTGMGIAPEDLPHLFQRFYRGQRASQSSVRGTGLGLNIVKEIVDWHGGEVEVQSEVSVGSTFTVWLPVA